MAESTDAQLASALLATGDWEVPAVAIAVVAPDATVATLGDVRRGFRLASVTKVLLAYACLVALEEGTIELDEPAGPPGATVRHLLAHTSGLGFDVGPLMPPGRKRVYSNTGMDALAAHLGERAGIRAQEYVAAAVFEPLGMSSTDVGNRSLAHGATSTVHDLTRFARELLLPTLVHADTLRAATTVQFPGLDGVLPGVGAQSPNDWGLGFELKDHKSPHWTGHANSPGTFGHFGGAGTCLWVDPAVDRALVVLTNREFGAWALAAWPPLADAVVASARQPAAQ